MRKRRKENDNMVVFLAYMHRYGWLVVVAVLAIIYPELKFLGLGIGSILYALWSICGYWLKWKHIYCSYQNAYRQKMTPYHISWNQMEKSFAYGEPIFFFAFGTFSIIVSL